MNGRWDYMWNTVLLDLDGTLADTGPGVTRSAQYALAREFGIRVENEHDLDSFVGPPLKQSFMDYAHVTSAEADRAIMRYRERYAAKGIFECTLYDGIRDLLARICAEGMRVAVASSKPTDYCVRILRYFGIEHYFSAVVGSEMDGSRVRKAEVIEEALRQLHMENRRSEVVMVGDRSYDVAGAKEAGVGSVGAAWGYGSRAELEEAWPDCITDNVTELRNVLIGQYRDGLRGFTQEQDQYGNGAYRQDASGAAYGQDAYGQDQAAFRQSPYGQPPDGLHAKNQDGSVIFRLWRIVYPLLLDVLISNAVAFIVLFIATFSYSLSTSDPYAAFNVVYDIYDSQVLLITGIADAVMVPVFWILLKNDENQRRMRQRTDRLLGKKGLGAAIVLKVLLLTFALGEVLNFLISIFDLPSNATYEALNESIVSSAPPVLILVVCIVGPISEEILFRGVIYRRARDYTGIWGGAIISALLFGLAHGNWIQGVFAFLFGILLALLYEHYGTLKITVAAHIFNNTLASFADLSGMSTIAYEIYLVVCAVVSVLLIYLIFKKEERVNRI